LRQLSILKTCFFGTLQKLIPIFLGHLLKQGLYMSMQLPSVYLLLRHFLAFLLVVFFWAFVSPVSRVPTLEAPSFLHQLVAFLDCQSVNVHCIQIMFLLGKVILSLWGLFLPGVPSGLFYSLVHLVKPVVNRCCPLVSVVGGQSLLPTHTSCRWS
jgi:hypothetical protein